MTREEEILGYCGENHYKPFSTEAFVVIKAIEWADQHPKKGLWNSEKVIEWLQNNAGSYLEDNHKFGEGSEYCTTELLDDLRKAMED